MNFNLKNLKSKNEKLNIGKSRTPRIWKFWKNRWYKRCLTVSHESWQFTWSPRVFEPTRGMKRKDQSLIGANESREQNPRKLSWEPTERAEWTRRQDCDEPDLIWWFVLINDLEKLFVLFSKLIFDINASTWFFIMIDLIFLFGYSEPLIF